VVSVTFLLNSMLYGPSVLFIVAECYLLAGLSRFLVASGRQHCARL
jgi:hypothetical protein